MKPYVQDKPKGQQIEEMFDGIAPAYDRLNGLFTAGIDNIWRAKTVRLVARENPGRILDVATGTGDMVLALARKVPGAVITGTDISKGMLSIAGQKADKAGIGDRVSLTVAAAEKMPFPDAAFDAVTVAFGVRNFHDMEKGLSEMARVLRPGGKIYILEFSTPRNKIFGALYRFYFHRVMPVLGGWISGDKKAYTYLPRSVDEFPQPLQFREILSRCLLAPEKSISMMNGAVVLHTAVRP